MAESLLLQAIRKITAIRLAEFAHLIKDEYDKITAEKEHPGDESAVAIITEIANHEDLAENTQDFSHVIVARKVGFGIDGK